MDIDTVLWLSGTAIAILTSIAGFVLRTLINVIKNTLKEQSENIQTLTSKTDIAVTEIKNISLKLDTYGNRLHDVEILANNTALVCKIVNKDKNIK